MYPPSQRFPMIPAIGTTMTNPHHLFVTTRLMFANLQEKKSSLIQLTTSWLSDSVCGCSRLVYSSRLDFPFIIISIYFVAFELISCLSISHLSHLSVLLIQLPSYTIWLYDIYIITWLLWYALYVTCRSCWLGISPMNWRWMRWRRTSQSARTVPKHGWDTVCLFISLFLCQFILNRSAKLRITVSRSASDWAQSQTVM